MDQRKQELLAVVDNLTRVHSEWQNDDNRPHMDATYSDAVDLLLDTFDAGDIPGDCRMLAASVERFRDEVEKFDERVDGTETPRSEFWARREELEQARGAAHSSATVDELPTLETMAELDAQGVSHRQIAQMYGLILPNGQPATQMVARELKTPGSVITKDWVDPRVKDRQAKASAAMAMATAAPTKPAKGTSAASVGAPCPETPLDLWEQGVGPEQSARMLKMPLATVQDLFSSFEADATAPAENTPVNVATAKAAAKKPAKAKAKSAPKQKRTA